MLGKRGERREKGKKRGNFKDPETHILDPLS
jgi:hypothetical protein